jgi:hypothetical protein
MGNLTLNSVIAAETILNPFNTRGDAIERFAILAAALTGATLEERLETYSSARELYNLRNLVVHQSVLHGEKASKDFRKRAFRLFLACLKALAGWAESTLAQGKKCDQEEFKDFYTRKVLSPVDPPNRQPGTA